MVAGSSSNTETSNKHGISALYIFTQHCYSFLLLLCFTFSLIMKSIHVACNHSRVHYVCSKVPEEVMHGDVGGYYCSESL